MESLINRYRNITILLVVILAQLVLLAVQVKNDQDVRMIRVWSVTAVTPAARVLEGLRSGTFGFLKNYILLRDVHEENRRLKADLDRVKMENMFLKTELSTADRAKALAQFKERTPSRTLAARVISTGASANSRVVYVDVGSPAGVMRGMGVVTPDGIVGKVIGVYPTASEVLLVTDPDFAAGVISQKHHVRGTMKGQGYANCKVDYVPNEEKVEGGEIFYTSGDDRIFPKGFPAGVVRVVRRGQPFQEILVEPAGMQHGVEEVLILLEGAHQAIPDVPPAATPVYMTPPPPAAAPVANAPAAQPTGTEADRLLQRYKTLGEAQGHKFGEGLPGSKPPDFNIAVPAARPAAVGKPVEGASGRVGEAAVPAAKPAATPGPKPSQGATGRVEEGAVPAPTTPKPKPPGGLSGGAGEREIPPAKPKPAASGNPL